MNETRAPTASELARVAEWVRNPTPGSKIEAARQRGVDLSQIVENLRLTPDQRVRKMQYRLRALEGGCIPPPRDLESEILELEAIAEIYALLE